jgi:antitoxin component YwqK of YwqJK toxin-antitoxin module
MSTEPEPKEPDAAEPAAITASKPVPWYRRIKPWQFSLRTLLVLMAVASGVCWYYLLPKRHEEKLAGGYLILKREYRGKGISKEPAPGPFGRAALPGMPASQLVDVFHGENAGYWRLSDLEGRLLVDGNYRKGKEDGWWTTYHPNGRKAVQGKMKAGERTGTWKTWAASGQLLSEVNYQPGLVRPGDEGLDAAQGASQLHGPASFWHENGKRSAKGPYAFNERHGSWNEWNEQEQLVASGAYVRGKRHGPWKEASDGDPQQLVSTEYVQGLKKELLDAHLKSLAERLEKGDISERLTLIGIAAEFGEPALPLIEKFAKDKTSPHVQLAAITAIGRCGGKVTAHIAALEALTESEDSRVALDARREIFRRIPEKRKEVLPALLKEAEQLAESSLAESLQDLRELFVLEPKVRDEVFPVVLQVMAKQLASKEGVGSGAPFMPLIGEPVTNSPAVVAKWRTEAVPYLKQGLDSNDKNVRLAVVHLIRQILTEQHGNDVFYLSQGAWPIPANLEPLVERAQQDSDPEVKGAAEKVNIVPGGFGGSGGLGGGGGLF